MIYVIDLNKKQVYYYGEDKAKNKIKLSDIDFDLLCIMANNDCYTLQDLSLFVFKSKRSLYYFDNGYRYYCNIKENINRLRDKGFEIKTISNIGYRLEDIIFIK